MPQAGLAYLGVYVSLPIALAGALFLTYFASRLFQRVLPGMLVGPVRLAAAHLLSLGVLGLFAAFMKSFNDLLREDAVLIYILPQLVWLLTDLYIGTARASRQGRAQRK